MTNRAEWMSGKRGLMVHYLPPLLEMRDGRRFDTVDEITSHFDLERFLADFDATGSEYLIFTFGQNTGLYNAPNPVIDHYAGPGHCSTRDLFGEIADALTARGKRLIGYLPCELNANRTLHAGFGWCTEPDGGQEVFQKRWLEVIRFWAERYAGKLSGWWFDGCYPWEVFHSDRLHWRAWYTAARAGNPDAAVTFNNGAYCADRIEPVNAGIDYHPGETTMLLDGLPRIAGTSRVYAPTGKYFPGSEILQHALLPVDAFWAHGSAIDWLNETLDHHPFVEPETLKQGEMEMPLYSVAELRRVSDAFRRAGGAVTFNVGIYLDGALGEASVAQLAQLG